MEQNSLTNKPLYQPCWISYLGSVSGIMKTMGKEEHDLVNTGGFTGYAFALPNVSKDSTCPSGPTSLGKMWDLIFEGTNALGFKTQLYYDHGCFPSEEGVITPEDRERAIELFQIVAKFIDKKESVVLWGIPIPEYGIITGYQGTSYLASTFRWLINQPEEPVAFDALQAPGSLHAITITKQRTDRNSQDVKITLKRAIALAEGKLTEENYVSGVKAYEEWAKVLENAPSEQVLYHGNSYNGECTQEAKNIACEFLKRLAKQGLSSENSENLLEASKEYKKITKILKSFVDLFPFASHGEIPKENRLTGANILRSIIPHEKRALALMKMVYNAMK
jgi:hypothetical protein